MAEWKEIKSFSDYEASSEGVIRNKETKQTIKPFKQTNGYYKIKIYKDHKPYTKMVHRIVAETFLGKSDLEVNHKDGNKTNNRLSNLEYVSRSENIKHAYKLGLIPNHAPKGQGKRVRCLTNGKTYESIHDASKELAIDRHEIRKVCNAKRKTSKGLQFVWD